MSKSGYGAQGADGSRRTIAERAANFCSLVLARQKNYNFQESTAKDAEIAKECRKVETANKRR